MPILDKPLHEIGRDSRVRLGAPSAAPLNPRRLKMVIGPATSRSGTLEGEAADASKPADDVISVVLMEDNRLVREALTSLLNRAPDIHAVADAPNGHQNVVLQARPDVVLLDLGLENGDSLRVARDIMRDLPETRVIVMDLLPAQEEITEFVQAGVSGFIVKDATLEVVVNTIRAVASGLKVLPDQITSTLFSEIAKEALSNGGSRDHDSIRMTEREREVIDLIAEGLSNKAIAKRLHISVHTVKSHLRNIMDKLTLHSRLQIAAYAHQRDAAE